VRLIIQAIMENQKLLILDEPFNALDESHHTIWMILMIAHVCLIVKSKIYYRTLNFAYCEHAKVTGQRSVVGYYGN